MDKHSTHMSGNMRRRRSGATVPGIKYGQTVTRGGNPQPPLPSPYWRMYTKPSQMAFWFAVIPSPSLPMMNAVLPANRGSHNHLLLNSAVSYLPPPRKQPRSCLSTSLEPQAVKRIK
jgi:hypothetical protein